MRVFENGSLIIYNTQRTDAGYYLCQASNGVGPGLSRVIKLTVHGKCLTEMALSCSWLIKSLIRLHVFPGNQWPPISRPK